MLKSYQVVGWGGGPYDFIVSPSPNWPFVSGVSLFLGMGLGLWGLGLGLGLDNSSSNGCDS